MLGEIAESFRSDTFHSAASCKRNAAPCLSESTFIPRPRTEQVNLTGDWLPFRITPCIWLPRWGFTVLYYSITMSATHQFAAETSAREWDPDGLRDFFGEMRYNRAPRSHFNVCTRVENQAKARSATAEGQKETADSARPKLDSHWIVEVTRSYSDLAV